jgi:hypothetical protein
LVAVADATVRPPTVSETAKERVQVSGLIWVVVGVVLALFPAAVALARVSTSSAPMRLVSRDGQTMMEITNVRAGAGQLVIKGCFMGAMPATTVVLPEEAWRGLGLIGIRVILAMPRLMLIGCWRCLLGNSSAKASGRRPRPASRS